MRRDGAVNRERILAAAETVFGTHGPVGSTDEIAQLSGVGIATVFRHFPTKKHLIEATAARYLEKMEVEVRRHLDAPDASRAFASTVRFLVWTGPTKVALLTLISVDGQPLSEPILNSVKTIRQVVGLILERAQAAGAVRTDVTVEDVFTLARALAHVATPDVSDVVDRAIEIVLDGLTDSR